MSLFSHKSLSYTEGKIAGITIKLLIVTLASKNYIQPLPELENIMPVENKLIVKSLHGCNTVKHTCLINIFNTTLDFIHNEFSF